MDAHYKTFSRRLVIVLFLAGRRKQGNSGAGDQTGSAMFPAKNSIHLFPIPAIVVCAKES